MQCSPWANRSCCTHGTTKDIHGESQPFDFDHCIGKAPMSEKCRRHFNQDYCFYECSPNVGPWIVGVSYWSAVIHLFMCHPYTCYVCDDLPEWSMPSKSSNYFPRMSGPEEKRDFSRPHCVPPTVMLGLTIAKMTTHVPKTGLAILNG